MEVTGQAFEDMQEQNIRLIQQLKEKDDANFKLMSEVSFKTQQLIPPPFYSGDYLDLIYSVLIVNSYIVMLYRVVIVATNIVLNKEN